MSIINEKLFSYGTLQNEAVQLAQFGRRLNSTPDTLNQYETRDCLIQDTDVIQKSGQTIHPIACFTANNQHQIEGKVFDVTEEEILRADQYEVADYKRVQCVLQSGTTAWVYVQSGLNIDERNFIAGEIKLALYHPSHLSQLITKAAAPEIWRYHHLPLYQEKIFQSHFMAKANKDIMNKSRCLFTIFYLNEIIGSTSFYDIKLDHLTLKIGYTWLHPDYWGKGINPVIKKMLLNYVFLKLKFNRVAFHIDANNTPSRNAIEKLGIPFEGLLKKELIYPDGFCRDTALYAITNDEWLALK